MIATSWERKFYWNGKLLYFYFIYVIRNDRFVLIIKVEFEDISSKIIIITHLIRIYSILNSFSDDILFEAVSFINKISRWNFNKSLVFPLQSTCSGHWEDLVLVRQYLLVGNHSGREFNWGLHLIQFIYCCILYHFH